MAKNQNFRRGNTRGENNQTKLMKIIWQKKIKGRSSRKRLRNVRERRLRHLGLV